MSIDEMFQAYADEKGFGPRILYVPSIGFATYHLSAGECYIEEIYVVPEKRRGREGTDIADRVTEIAKEHGIKTLTGSVSLKAKTKDASIKALMYYGMSPVLTSGEMIYFSKEI